MSQRPWAPPPPAPPSRARVSSCREGGSEKRRPRRPGWWPRDLGTQGPARAGQVLGSDLTATPHSPRWLRTGGSQKVPLIPSPSTSHSSRKSSQTNSRLPLPPDYRPKVSTNTPWLISPLQMSRQCRRPRSLLRSCQTAANDPLPQLRFRDHTPLGPGPPNWTLLGSPPAPSLSTRLLSKHSALLQLRLLTNCDLASLKLLPGTQLPT